MYNSVIIRFLVKIWDILVFCYEKSLVKRIGSSIGKLLSKLSKASIFKSLFTEDLNIIENTFLYKVYENVIDFYNNISKKMNTGLKKIQRASITSGTLDKLFKDNLDLIKTFSIFFMFFGIGVIINSIVRGTILVGSILASVILIIMGLIVLQLGEKTLVILNNSWIVSFVLNMFRVEEGGDQWW